MSGKLEWSALGYQPVFARTRAIHPRTPPVSYDRIRVIAVRDGSAILFSEFGQKPVTVGDVFVLGANTLCGGDPEGHHGDYYPRIPTT